MKHSRFFAAVPAILITALIAGCASAKLDIPYEATDREIIQIAQTEYDAGRVSNALQGYNTLLSRYGNNVATYIEGRYEIAHIYLKQKNYSQAVPIYREILDIYDNAAMGMLPPSFLKLTRADWNKIPEAKRNEH